MNRIPTEGLKHVCLDAGDTGRLRLNEQNPDRGIETKTCTFLFSSIGEA